MRRDRWGSCALLLFAASAAGQPSVTGQSGLIAMPDARVAGEGAWRTGVSLERPYQALWSSVALFPWLEGAFRYTRIYHVPGFAQDTGYGNFKDKSFDAKLIALPERGLVPALAFGMQDVGGGTGVFRATYVAASKRAGELDLTAGVGAQRIDGLFGGVRWSPARLRGWSVVAEYDAFDYRRDVGAARSGAAGFRKGPAAGIEYQHDWFGAKVFSAHGHPGFNAYVSVPLDRREFLPKVNEPPPFTRIVPRPSEAQWHADPAHRARLARALAEQDFRDVALRYEHGRLEAVLTNTRISSMPRAVGRAARTLLSFAPLQVREIRITYREGPLPLATYSFVDLQRLQRYFNGMASRQQLAQTVSITYARPAQTRETEDVAETLAAFEEPLPESLVLGRDGADLIALRGENVAGGRFRLRPGLSTFFNDPSGAFRFDLYAAASYDRPIARQTFLQAQTRLTLYEDVSGVTQPSNSTLPHVRTDVAEYKRGPRFKLTRLLANRFYQPAERVYARASAGIYEEMFSGAGGQVLYLSPDRWAIDFDANAVRQRDFQGWFGHRDYTSVTALASVNYRMAQGVTATARAGRFLARDEGVRGEVKRRFASGVEVGAWYTVTNGRDITSPGTPSSPYHDKGVFVFIPLETLLTYDTQAAAAIALAPWTRDVGQMVASPGDLYRILERPLVQMEERDGLSRFGDRDDDYDLPRLGAERRWPDFALRDLSFAGREAAHIDWIRTLAFGAALTLAARPLDHPLDRFAGRHGGGDSLGSALPVMALGASALFAFDDSRPRLADAGTAALEAGALSFVAAEALKRAVHRERPDGRGDDSFPSRHTALMWAAVTPYAETYDAPWLYAVAGVTNAARTLGRHHWFSDTVAGAALGYGLGHLMYRSRRASVSLGPSAVTVRWDL